MPPKHAPIRARDLRANIAEYGFEKGVVTTLEMFFDEWIEARQHQREMVELLGTCIDQIDRLVNVGDAMSKRIDQIKRDKERNEDASE